MDAPNQAEVGVGTGCGGIAGAVVPFVPDLIALDAAFVVTNQKFGIANESRDSFFRVWLATAVVELVAIVEDQ